jgi:hypothetical protein
MAQAPSGECHGFSDRVKKMPLEAEALGCADALFALKGRAGMPERSHQRLKFMRRIVSYVQLG